MRYNNIERLRLWRNRGQFPAIHDNIYNAILTYMEGNAALDLCCGFGLLAQRVKEAGYIAVAVGVDDDEQAIREAEEHAIEVELHHLKINTETISEVAKLVKASSIDVMFARRCFPELFGGETAGCDLATGIVFAQAMCEAGVRELFVEGRVQQPGAKNNLPSVAAEVSMLSESFREVKRIGAVSYLRAK